MNIGRRVFNQYLVTGLAGGACIGFTIGRYGTGDNCSAPPLPPVEALRSAADQATGVHLIGQSIDGVQEMSTAGSERLLLARLGLGQETALQPQQLVTALNAAIREDYTHGRLAEAGEFLFSETELLFVAYAVIRQGLHDEPYTPPVPEVQDGIIADKTKFGPKFTVVGQIFNEQPDGHAGLWVVAENTPPGTVITINGKAIKTTRKQASLTGAVYGEKLHNLIAKPDRHEIALFVPETGIRQILGEMEIRPRPRAAILEDGRSSTVFCEIDKWSVIDTTKGERIRANTLCRPRSSVIYVGDIALTTHIKPKFIEGWFSRSLFARGEHPLRLVDSLSGEAVSLGMIQID